MSTGKRKACTYKATSFKENDIWNSFIETRVVSKCVKEKAAARGVIGANWVSLYVYVYGV